MKLIMTLLIVVFPLIAFSKSNRASEDNLTRAFAQGRKSQIRAVAYDIRITLQKKSKEFFATTIIDVELAKLGQPLSIDFVGKKILGVKVNDAAIKDYVTRTGSFDIPQKYLKDKTKIEIDYVIEYAGLDAGIYHSVDPADDSEYFYTDLEPYYAHYVFPCFDQPDLKAKMTLSVVAPGDWKVIGNEFIASTKNLGDTVETRFKPTPLMSTYLFFMGAGPFAEWKDSHDGIPLTLYARKSIAANVDVANIFSITKKGLQFFAEYFGHKYPFSKYGQIFVPDFESEGMENPGAVTLDESRVFTGQVSTARLRERENLILHEMAHMWFGDLVTMAWWDDLWLNESFASYLASIAQDRALKSENSWIDFFQFKLWGLWQDNLVTSHPIEAPVPDVRTSKGNFDGITYAKGAAALKQLHFLTTDAGFKKGLKDYFHKHAFQNTTRADFISAISQASGKNLNDWTKQWLSTKGPNRISNTWACRDGKVSSFVISQKPNASGALLTHQIRTGLYKITGSAQIEKIEEQDVLIQKASTPVSDLVGEKCPGFVFTNIDDLDYALHLIDEQSMKSINAILANPATDPLLRAAIWHAIGQRVKDTEMSLQTYFEIVIKILPQESNEAVLTLLMGHPGASGPRGQIREMYSNFLTPEQRRQLAPRLEALIQKRVRSEKPHSNLQLAFFDFFLDIASSPDTLLKLVQFLAGEQIPNGIKIDQDRRWAIIHALSQHGYEGVGGLITLEESKERTLRGQKNAYVARASIPHDDAKKKYWADLASNKIPLSTLQQAARGFNDSDHADLVKAYMPQFFSRVLSINWKENDQFVDLYFQHLFPKSLCTPELLSESQRKLKGAKNLTPLVKRAWLESNDELSNCLKVRKAESNKNLYF